MFYGKFLSAWGECGTFSEEWTSFPVSELELFEVMLSLTRAVLWLWLFADINIHSVCA